MSRIHEALKRAELERANARAIPAESAPAEPAEPAFAVQTVVLETIVPAAEKTPEPTDVLGASSFESLWARRRPHAAWRPDPDTNVFDAGQGDYGAEQFRTLRSRLYHIRNHHPLKTVLITSPMAGEGKTFVAGNLARSIVRQKDRRVLVIDADLRLPHLHAMFGAPSSPGLTDYLRGDIDEASAIQFGEAGNVSFIPSGTRVNDASELLSNGRMKTLLEKLSPAFDWIFIDCPPCLPVADPGVIAQWCDGLLLVVRANYMPSAVIAKARQELKGRNIVGVVLNAVEANSSSYGSYGSYGGYGDSAA